MIVVLRQRNFALLWFGQLISMTGDWVLAVTLPFYVYELTGSTLATGATLIAETLPTAILGSLAGVFVDRWNRKWIMISTDFLRAFVLLFLLLVHSRDMIWIVYAVAALESTFALFFNPAKSALAPCLVGEQHLIAANSLDAISDNLTRLIGPLLGGILLGLFGGLSSVVFVDSLSFVISGVMIWGITLASNQPKEQTYADDNSLRSALISIWREWLNGLRFVKDNHFILGTFIVMGVIALADGPLNVLIVPFVKGVMQGNVLTLSWLLTARGIGGLAGGFITGWLGKILRPVQLIAVGLGALAGIFLIIANFPKLPLAGVIIGFAVAGVAVLLWSISIETLLQISILNSFRGRILATYWTTYSLLGLVSVALASTLGDLLGIVLMLNAASCLYLIAGGIALALPRKANTTKA